MNGDPRADAAARREEGGDRVRRLTRHQGVFMISVAAELAEMHPQTLRMYEDRGLIKPQRSPKGTRLYSQEDVDRLRRIQELTCELGMNLAGVERVFELEAQIERMQQARARARGEGRGAAPRRWRRSSRRSAAPSAPRSCATRRRGRRSCRSACAARPAGAEASIRSVSR